MAENGSTLLAIDKWQQPLMRSYKINTQFAINSHIIRTQFATNSHAICVIRRRFLIIDPLMQ